MSIQIQFTPWRPFYARKNSAEIERWLRAIGQASVQAFRRMGNYPPASTPSEYPAIRTGRLRGSIDFDVTSSSVTVGSNMPYSVFLRYGTSRMARRKMSD